MDVRSNPPEKAYVKEMDAPVLLSSRGRSFLASKEQAPAPLYVLARDWVNNPRSTLDATEARKRARPHAGVRPSSINLGLWEGKPLDTSSVDVPDIDDAAPCPTLKTHLPRWKALGKLMRLEGARRRQMGLERLQTRLAKKKKK
jgi:hypothetical protein